MVLRKLRSQFIRFTYTKLIKPILFLQDPEAIHDRFILAGRVLNSNPFTRSLVSVAFKYSDPILQQIVAGITFKNPVGLAAGFDKDAQIPRLMYNVGFGFAEVGSITAKPYEGNPRPRLKRLIESKSIWVNYGLKNQGADIIHNHLSNKYFPLPIGINIAKTNSLETTTPKLAILDYLYTIKLFQDKGDYIAINISCPNAFGGCQFHDPLLLNQLLFQVDKLKIQKPVFLKLSPDLSKSNLDKIIEVTDKHHIAGFICTNLNKDHDLPTGGMSGKLVEEKSNRLIKYLYKKTQGKYVIIGLGGIFSAEDAYKKIRLGASLVQLITGMIFQGPSIIGEINCDLARLLRRDGFKNISESVGADNK